MRPMTLIVAAALIAGAGTLLAQSPPGGPGGPGGPPPGGQGGPPPGGAPRGPMAPSTPASKDPAAAVAGLYNVDPGHASVIARVGHQTGFSLTTFRFDKVSGTLDWNPADPEKSKADIAVDPGSIVSNVANFADRLRGDRYLDVAKYPEARFVSTAIKRTGATTGVITGNLTFFGQTHPIEVQARMIGAGSGMRGPVVGFSGTTTFSRKAFGFASDPDGFSDAIELIIDIEFHKA